MSTTRQSGREEEAGNNWKTSFFESRTSEGQRERKEGRNSGRKVCGGKSVENNLVFLSHPPSPFGRLRPRIPLGLGLPPALLSPPLAPARRDRLRGDVQGPKKEGGRKGKETRQQHVAQISFPPFESDTFLFLDHKGPTFRPSLPPSHTRASAAAAAEEPACRICPVAAGKGGEVSLLTRGKVYPLHHPPSPLPNAKAKAASKVGGE